MKRVLTFLAIMLLPLSVMAMTPVSDSTLSDVTGQAGVNINADLTMNIAIGTMAWGDADGIHGFNDPNGGMSPWTTVAAGGYVGVTGFNITNLRIKARETDGHGVYFSSAMIKPITIDVATGTKNGVANVTFVRFGLGSLQVSMDAMSFGVQMGATTALGQVLGTVNMGAMSLYFSPKSYIDIYAHAGCGVNFDFNVIVDEFNLTYVSWGDTDGLAGVAHTGTVTWIDATGTAGYVGLQNLTVGGPITIAGSVAIDVVSVATNGGVYGGSGLAPFLHQTATTVVHISFPSNFSINVTGPIRANVNLAADRTLTTTAHTLGDIYISGLNITVAQGSWVDIWAH